MKTLICLENISYSEFNNQAIEYVNEYTKTSIEEVSFCSLDETFPFKSINTAVFKPIELDSFYDGIVIANSIQSMNIVMHSPTNSKKILYLQDLDWMFEQMLYNDVYSILSDKDIILISRSEEHISPIKNISHRRPDAIIEKFNLEKIWNLL